MKKKEEKDVFTELREHCKKRKKRVLYAILSFVGILMMSAGCLIMSDGGKILFAGAGFVTALTGIFLELNTNK